MPHNALASWSLGLGLLSLPLLWVFWPVSPPVAVGAIVCGVLGVRESSHRGLEGRTRALVGIFYAVLALAVLGVILVLAVTSDLAAS